MKITHNSYEDLHPLQDVIAHAEQSMLWLLEEQDELKIEFGECVSDGSRLDLPYTITTKYGEFVKTAIFNVAR